MNQILITEKLYITPELKRKKKIYRFNFLISIVLIIILFSVYAYAEYDRNRSEEYAKEILDGMTEDPTTISSEDDTWVVALDGNDDSTGENNNDNQSESTNGQDGQSSSGTTITNTYTASNGRQYTMVGTVNIPSINVNYPILSETTDSLLKVSVCKFWGSNPNEVGNLCVAGHNYRNSRFFSKVPTLSVGDIIEITDLNNTTLKYSVFDKFTVDPSDTSCTSQITNGKKIVTLITCTNDSKQRVVVKAEAV